MKSAHNSKMLQSSVPQADIKRSKFDRSNTLKTTFDVDDIVPVFLDEVLPGDTHILKTKMFGRLATPINPIMDNMKLDLFYFFVPMRLVWENTHKFFGEQDSPGDSIDYLIPTRTTSTGVSTGTISDYFGIPIFKPLEFNNLPHRAYWLIYDEWFRDQNLQDSAAIVKDDSGAILADEVSRSWNVCAKRGKRHDYFTSCLPFAQKGDPVTINLASGDAKAYVQNDANVTGNLLSFRNSSNQAFTAISTSGSNATRGGSTGAVESTALYADLDQVAGATINEWRQAFQIQKFLERDARGGTRYTEKIKAHFGVTSPDARLQRPEYLGGSSSNIHVHPVTQTSSTDDTTPQGNLSAFGTVSETDSGFVKSFTEHGYIIGLANVRADLTYQQGLDKLWSRSEQYDFYFPSFAHLGEQAVLNKEIYVAGASQDLNVFGYQERYAEYRYKRSQITGKFRSNASGTLDSWHLSQEFSETPNLNSNFIESNTPVDRVIAVPSEPHIIADFYFDYKSVRPMPVYGTPGYIDHF